MILLWVNQVIMGGSFAFIMLYQPMLPRSPETFKPAHKGQDGFCLFQVSYDHPPHSVVPKNGKP